VEAIPMAKKRPAKKNKSTPKNSATDAHLPDDTIEIHLPPRLYEIAEGLDPVVLDELLRAIFDNNSLFDVKQVQIRLGNTKTATAVRGGDKLRKVCE
jgi:hypothetical protein